MPPPGGSANIVLFVNGVSVKTTEEDPLLPLVTFIRDRLGLKGTKTNCEYGCTGACTVIITTQDKTNGSYKHRAISSCMTPLAACHWSNITTVEGVGTSQNPHPLQTRLAECHAVQCGYDAPGTVVSMFGLLLNKQRPLLEEIEKSLVGNLSRCNGYRAVLEAYRQFAESSNNEKEKFEASLPSLQHEDLEPVNLGTTETRWFSVPSLVWLRTLQLKDPLGAVFFGIPNLNELEGVKTVFDVSRIEVSKRGTKGFIEIAANATLTDLVETLANLGDQTNEGVIKEMISGLESIKTVQYRNARAVADALTDCFVVRAILLTLNATLAITEKNTSRTVLLKELLTDKKSIVIKSINVPVPSENQVFMFYSISDRKANGSNSEVAIFGLTLEKEVISECVIFAGNAKTGEKCMEAAAKELNGKKSNDLGSLSENLENVSSIGIQQKGILVKFLNDLAVYALCTAEEKKKFYVRRNHGRKAIQSTQFTEHVLGSFEESHAPVGKPVATTQGLDCATGEAVFVDDMPRLEHELFFAPVLSPIAHGRILSIDASAALEIEGVVRFVSAKDVPEGRNRIKVRELEDEKLFAEDIVEYEGDMIGAILGKNEKIARHAAALVKVELEELVPVVSLQEAILKDAPMQLPDGTLTSLCKGQVDEALENSERLVKGYIQTPRQEHFYEETHCIFVIPTGERKEIDVYVSTANQLQTHHHLAAALMLPQHKINVFTKRVGCSYGGKVGKNIPFYAAVALAAKIVNKPVRSRLTRDEDIKIMGQRGEFLGEYTVGVSDGKLMGVKFNLAKNAGWSSNDSPGIVSTAMCHIENAYDFPSLDVQSKIFATNTASNTAFRGFGAPPAMAITENMIFDICAEMGFDPLEFRRNNLQEEGYVTAYSQVMKADDVTVRQCLDTMVELCHYYEVKKDVEHFNANNKFKKRGIALIPNKYGIGIPSMYGQGSCLLNIYIDGTVQLTVNGIELGQGLYTKMTQIASQELGIPMSKIQMSSATTKVTPNPMLTGGSTAADLSGNAVKNACEEINLKLAPLRSAQPDAPWELLVGMAFGSRINLSVAGFYRTPEDKYTFDPATKTGQRWWYYTSGAAFSYVEVDLLTGQHTLLKADIITDVGESVNPAIDIAQIEGAFIQGYGYMAMEDTLYDSKGQLVSRGHDEYSVPCIADCPSEFNVTLLKGKKAEKHLLYSSKGIGEPPFFNGVSVFFAVKDALLSAHREAGHTGTFNLKAPCTPRNVLLTIDGF